MDFTEDPRQNISDGDIGTITISGTWEKSYSGDILFVFGDKTRTTVIRDWEAASAFVTGFTYRRPVPQEDITETVIDGDRDIKVWACMALDTDNMTWEELWEGFVPLRTLIQGPAL
jgi:hypothetical protein